MVQNLSIGTLLWCRRSWNLGHKEVSPESRPQEALTPFEKETSGYWGFVLLSGSLLGTWAHFSNGSSRSRFCRTWLQIADTQFKFLCDVPTNR